MTPSQFCTRMKVICLDADDHSMCRRALAAFVELADPLGYGAGTEALMDRLGVPTEPVEPIEDILRKGQRP